MDPVVHFEMPATDKERMAQFYSSAFGWQTQILGPEMGEYVLATTTERDTDGMPKQRGAINGGFYLKNDAEAAQYPSIVISVVDINQAMQQVAQAGGTVIGEPMEIPGVGLYVSFFDTEGNRASMLQPKV